MGKQEENVQPPATWLVTTDGRRIELSKPWRLDGRRILFETPSGTLSTVRASEIDIDASREPTPKDPSQFRPRRLARDPGPVLTLTNRDIARFDSPSSEQSLDEDLVLGDEAAPASPLSAAKKDEDAPSTKEKQANQLAVDGWKDLSEGSTDTVLIYGSVSNKGRNQAKRVFVRVSLLDEEGNALAKQAATLTKRTINAGGTSNFQVGLSSPVPYTSVEFEVGQK